MSQFFLVDVRSVFVPNRSTQVTIILNTESSYLHSKKVKAR